MENNISLAVLVIIMIVSIGNFYMAQIKGKSKKEILHMVREKSFQLFLYAEKQNWTGPEKMDWCVDQISKLFPTELQMFVKEPIKQYVEKMYSEFKDTITTYLTEESEK